MSRSYMSAFGTSKSSVKSAKADYMARQEPLEEGRYHLEVISASLYLRHRVTGEELDFPAWGLVLNPKDVKDSRRVIVRLQASKNTDMTKFSAKVNFLLAALGADADKTFKVTEKEFETGVKPMPALKGRSFMGRITPATDKEGNVLIGLYDLNYVG